MLELLLRQIRMAGDICVEEQANLDEIDREYKSAKDLVSRVDREVEAFLREQINTAYPDHDIIGEGGDDKISGASHCWYIDPIDGTTSYSMGQPYYSISVAV